MVEHGIAIERCDARRLQRRKLLGLGSSGGDAPAVAVQDSTGTTGATSISLTRAKPMDAYLAIGGDIKRCWFNPVDGLLPKHVYRADVSPDGNKVQISVHQKIELGRAGMTTYVIDFKQSGPSTVITTENRTMPPDLAAKMQFDSTAGRGVSRIAARRCRPRLAPLLRPRPRRALAEGCPASGRPKAQVQGHAKEMAFGLAMIRVRWGPQVAVPTEASSSS